MSTSPPEPAEPQGGGAASPPRPPPPPGPGLPALPASQPPLARQNEASEAKVARNAAPRYPSEPQRHSAGEPGWAAWQGMLGFAAALLGTLVLGAVVVGAVALATGIPLRPQQPVLNIVGVVVQDFVFVAAAVGFAALTARPRAWHFGLRRTRLGATVGWATLGIVFYFGFNIAYEALVEPRAQQSVADALGVNDSAALLLVGGFVVIVMAPIAEELFFRAFFYRALRNSLARRMGRWGGAVLGAVLTGLLFGAVHFEPDAVAIIPVLAALGVMFCLVYERTGSLFSVIALHALINATAYLAVAKNSWPVALGFGGAMVAGCIMVPRFLSRGPAPAAA